MDNAKHQDFYEATLTSYRRMFSNMDELDRLSFFVSMDESAILGFVVGEGESISDAEARHEVKLLAIAEALSSLPCTAREQRVVEDLRALAAASAKRRAIRGGNRKRKKSHVKQC